MRDGLLPRMEARLWADGKTTTYRYHPVGRKPVNLGTDLQAALRRVLDMNGESPHRGTFTWADGERYEGEWAEDKRSGRGTYTWPDVARYEGEWAEGKYSGRGVFRYADGDSFDGAWRGDCPQSGGTAAADGGAVYRASFSGTEPGLSSSWKVRPYAPSSASFSTASTTSRLLRVGPPN